MKYLSLRGTVNKTLACCLPPEYGEILRKEFAQKINARLIFSPTWEMTRFYISKNVVDHLIVPATISEQLLADINSRVDTTTSIIILGARTSAQKLICGTSGRIFKQRDSYQLLENRIRTVGADVRNDLNNPLQEIVALLYVAKATQEIIANEVLEALHSAALRMNTVVNGIEAKICNELSPLAA